jgi:alkanesulfonate monooxygenase SsuD/methylene tetrahydromethanopterin reductase-like flavin-dependent oxidoreductase (luciferase family)
MGAASLARLSEDRFNLGLGVSTPKAIEDLHGQSFSAPIKRTIETIELVTEYLSDAGRVSYSGDIYQVQDFPSLDRPVPIFNAALGPANREVTGRYCDGWLPNNVPVSHLA